VVADAYLVFIVYGIPVESVFVLLVVEEAVVLVDDLPERFEIALGGIVVLDFVNARN
jgi:hypothetical protein